MGPPNSVRAALCEGPARVVEVQWHERVTSTNDVALDAARHGAPDGLLVGAEQQTAGRGRRGRRWLAPLGAALTISWLVRPRLRTWTLLPLAAGLGVGDVVAEHAPAELKWPNDVLVGDEKIAGVLVEKVAGAAVVGVGLNVDWRTIGDRPARLTSLAEQTGGAVDRWTVLVRLCARLTARLHELEHDPAATLEAYTTRCTTIGRRVRAEHADRVLDGTAIAVDAAGALGVVAEDGTTSWITAAGVVHLR